MNLSEALDAALPEIPKTRLARSRPPRLDPELIVREDVLDGEPVVGILQRDKANFFRFSPSQWQLAQMFDGVRSYEEIAELFTSQTGTSIPTEDVRGFAESLEESGLWYKTPQEKNLALHEKLTAQRERRGRSKVNLAHISFSAWDPDRYLGWLDGVAGDFIYSHWCVLAAVLLFVFEAAVFVSTWKFMEPDIITFYNFTNKSFLDFAQFWMLLLMIGFVHETAHGLTCKHYGGQVHSMGLMFLYLAPAFYCDVTESWAYATKLQRLATIIAGIWIELMICGLAMIVWFNTLPGEWLHDFMYQVILLTGVAVVVLNLNPLIKLDGYYFLTEAIEIPDLKERSTAFLSAWFQNRILRLPIVVPVVPRRRAPLFVFYAFVSGAYSYTLLFVVVRFSYNITSKWMAEFALIPAGALAFVIFRSRLRALRNVTSQVWEKRFGLGMRWRPVHTIVTALVAAIFFLPLLRDRENAYYVIEPMHAHTLHASVPGRVNAVFVNEGETVHAGQPLLRMSSIAADSMQSYADEQAGSARFQAFNAQMQGRSIGAAAAQQSAAIRFTGIAREAQSSLVVDAPVDGTLLTQNPAQLIDQDVASGQALLDLADAGPRVARIFIPASVLDRIPAGAEVALVLPGRFSVLRLKLAPPGGDAVPLPAGLIATPKYKGINLPVFYCSRIPLPAQDGQQLFGLSGEAKIFGVRRSIAERVVTVGYNLVKTHVW
jgi:putative peptide zinc metalloprotease protein